ncbi:MAG: hypothetical protein U5L11_08215 [Arhodomonas sp.]|nr:hypothetical protein [Arhodomonas sp.]
MRLPLEIAMNSSEQRDRRTHRARQWRERRMAAPQATAACANANRRQIAIAGTPADSASIRLNRRDARSGREAWIATADQHSRTKMHAYA